MNKFGRVAVCGAISNYNGDFGKGEYLKITHEEESELKNSF